MTHYMKVDIEHPQMEPEEVEMEPIYDVYDTEFKEKDDVYYNQNGELLHKKNIIQYCLDEGILSKVTR